MYPRINKAQHQQRQSPGRPRPAELRRLLGYLRPHWRFLTLGIVASILYGFLSSVGIVGMLPVMHVLLSEEGLHRWVDRSLASQRLGLDLEVRNERIAIVRVHGHAREAIPEIAPLQAITGWQVPASDEPLSPDTGSAILADTFLEQVATAAPNTTIRIRTSGVGDSPGVTDQLPLRDPSVGLRLGRWAARALPQETTRGDRIKLLAIILVGVVVLNLIGNLARFVAQYYIAIGTMRGVMDMRRHVYRRILQLPMDYFSRDVSDLVSRFVQDAQEIQRGLLALFGKAVREPLRAFFFFGWALWLDAGLTLRLALIGPVALLVFWIVGRKIRKATGRLLRAYGVMIGALSTTLHAIGLVKAYNAETQERIRLWQIDRQMFRRLVCLVKLEALLRPLLEVLAVIGMAVLTLWLGTEVIYGRIELPTFATLLLALGMMVDPLRKLSDVYPRVVRAFDTAAQRTFEVADLAGEDELQQDAIDLPPLHHAIELQDVTFTYPGADQPALNDVSLTIRQGETIALVGANGSGKTTLTKLLLRFHDPQAGRILFDGRDARQITLRSLRRQFSLVSQDPVVFAMTLAENIGYGTRRPDPDRVRAAARQAFAEQFILEKPEQYEELVGERGSTLSGGQRQRLCIARAIMRDAPILIFDEATSQVDSESEKQIQEAVLASSVTRTTVLIAHRLSTIRFAQRIVVMADGRILDHGTHDALLGRCEVYAALCRSQLDK